MRGSVRVASVVVVAAVALTAGGCRQLFGIDDTQVAGDDVPAPDGPPRPDGSDPVTCAADHVLCMDFDTPETGIGQLPLELVQGGAMIDEIDANDAPSPPRVLAAMVVAGAGDSQAIRAQQYPAGEVTSSHVKFSVRVSSAKMTEACAPGVLVLLWTDPSMAFYTVSLNVDAGLEIVVQTPSLQLTDEVALLRDVWTSVELRLDVEANQVQLDTDSGGTLIMQTPDLSPTLTLDSVVGLGASITGAHGACSVEIDDFALDSPLS